MVNQPNIGTGGGKGLGIGRGRPFLSRRRLIIRDAVNGVTKPAIRRLSRRAGVKRISGNSEKSSNFQGTIYEETREVAKNMLQKVIRDAVIFTEHACRKTVSSMDVIYALKRQGKPIYGFVHKF